MYTYCLLIIIEQFVGFSAVMMENGGEHFLNELCTFPIPYEYYSLLKDGKDCV